MTLSSKLGVLEISTLSHFRLPLLIQMFIKVASSPRLSGIGMPSPILWSHLLKMQRIVLLSSLLWWELGTNSPITGSGEWLFFRRFSSKLSWSWSWSDSDHCLQPARKDSQTSSSADCDSDKTCARAIPCWQTICALARPRRRRPTDAATTPTISGDYHQRHYRRRQVRATLRRPRRSKGCRRKAVQTTQQVLVSEGLRNRLNRPRGRNHNRPDQMTTPTRWDPQYRPSCLLLPRPKCPCMGTLQGTDI